MSESNAPFNHPDQSESADTAVDWENPFADLADSIHLQDDRSLEDLFFEAEQGSLPTAAPLATAAPEPTPVPIDAVMHRSTSPDPVAAIAAWSESAATEPAEVDVTDLISLIQELNQCNSILLDRVSQLEEALESSQVALQAEVGRSQDGAAESPVAELTAAPEAIVSLFNQLEFAHQTHQRQQILIETLTGQLESSQERVAELERESALIQQRYSEQVQSLGQAESSNRDLQARLHRQQRYTLQFKAALEKCLEVPTPQYDLGAEGMAEAIMGDNPFLLKTQKIQPWSAQADSVAQFPWMKLGGLLEKLDELSESEESASLEPETSTPASALSGAPAGMAMENLSSLKLPQVDLPAGLDHSTAGVSPQDSASVQQILQILPDLLAIEPHGAIAAEPSLESAASQPQPDVALPQVELRVEAEMQSAVPERRAERGSESLSEGVIPDSAEGEDALWQDLARLIEVSTEDMVRASLSGDFSAFEAINFDALPDSNPSILQPMPQSVSRPAQSAVTQDPPEASLDSASLDSSIVSEEGETTNESFIPALSQPSWPSPVVYPLRSTKKQRSSGVDLPSFLRPGTDPLPT